MFYIISMDFKKDFPLIQSLSKELTQTLNIGGVLLKGKMVIFGGHCKPALKARERSQCDEPSVNEAFLNRLFLCDSILGKRSRSSARSKQENKKESVAKATELH